MHDFHKILGEWIGLSRFKEGCQKSHQAIRHPAECGSRTLPHLQAVLKPWYSPHLSAGEEEPTHPHPSPLGQVTEELAVVRGWGTACCACAQDFPLWWADSHKGKRLWCWVCQHHVLINCVTQPSCHSCKPLGNFLGKWIKILWLACTEHFS